MTAKTMADLSAVEKIALKGSSFKALYPPKERIKTIVVDNFPALGKLAAMRFIEWVQANPGGIISLPTGKTPEHFIKWVARLLDTWDKPDTQTELESSGIDPVKKPDMKSLHFVQIDEFYPIDSGRTNSFYYYVNKYYINGFGLDPKKALLINSSTIGLKRGQKLETVWPENEVELELRFRPGNNELEREQKKVIERIDQWCQGYEEKIRDLGGIGFFLGGIGPDGHIGFNVRGSNHLSTTRLTHTNYETQAAAAVDLGGIEISRKRLVITIGLGTITFNPDCAAIIIVAGESKAGVVASAIQSKRSLNYPATSLQTLKNAAFYISKGASGQLRERQVQVLKEVGKISDKKVNEIVVDLSLNKKKRVLDLNEDDFKSGRLSSIVLEKSNGSVDKIKENVHKSLVLKMEKGMNSLSGTNFLHTEPHHDDLMLGYFPFIVRHTRTPLNRHNFVTMTSGFTAVTNFYIRGLLKQLNTFLEKDEFIALAESDYYDVNNHNSKNRDVWQYLDGVAAESELMKSEGVSRRLLRNLIEIYGEKDLNSLILRVDKLLYHFKSQYPGAKDPEDIQKLKGMCREWEAECLWGYFGWNCSNVHHLRLGFYKGELFGEDPEIERDVEPLVKIIKETNPDVVSVALDPEGAGPDTHYKVLQALTKALEIYEEDSGRQDIVIWGYRNVWCRFHPAEASIFVPVSLNMFSIMQSAFMNTYVSQKNASFPSFEHDGPFCELAQKIQVEQYQKIKTCLGREWFNDHPSPLIRATRGLVYLEEMTLQELYGHSRKLKLAAENK